MKKFRRTILKTTTFRHIFLPFLIPLFLFSFLFDTSLNSIAWYYLIIIMLLFFIALIIQLFYITLEDNSFIIKNSVCPFLHETHLYKDIEKVYIKRPRGMAPPYIQIITVKHKRHAWKYIIDSVAPEEYDELIKAIESKGVVVEAKNLVNWN